MHHRLIVMVIIMLSMVEVHAIAWNFDEDGNSQGWLAQVEHGSGANNLARLHSEVSEGTWRVQPHAFQEGLNPDIQLISPLLGYDSSLFDRMTIRFRLIHSQPVVEGGFWLTWTNGTNRRSPGGEILGDCFSGLDICFSRFKFPLPPVTYTTDWQEIAIRDLETKFLERQYTEPSEILWEGELIDIRLSMSLWPSGVFGYRIQGQEEIPELVEIDWIELTGVEVQLQGELPPPMVTASGSFGATFSAPVFYSLGVQDLNELPNNLPMALGDLDGDEDVDLLTTWGGARSS